MSTTIKSADEAGAAVDAMLNATTGDAQKKAATSAAALAVADANKMIRETSQDNKDKIQATKEEKSKADAKAKQEAAE